MHQVLLFPITLGKKTKAVINGNVLTVFLFSVCHSISFEKFDWHSQPWPDTNTQTCLNFCLPIPHPPVISEVLAVFPYLDQ